MSESLDRIEAEGEAKRVLTRFAVAALPVSPFLIAEGAGIEVRSKDSSDVGVSGFLVRVGNEFGIGYSRHIENPGFIRFTVAHELGHYFLPGHADHLFPNGNGVHESRGGFVSADRYERQADFFACALLMPESFFKAEMDRAGEGLAAIETLSGTFRTSLTSTAIRYVGLTERAAAVVMSIGRRIDYCVMSARIRELSGITWISKGDFLTVGTTTARFNASPGFVEQSRRADGTSTLDDWFDGAPEVEVSEEVIGLGRYGRTLTILYTDEDIEMEEEED